MSSSSPAPWRQQDSEHAVVLTFVETRLLDEDQVRAVGDLLLHAADRTGARSLVLNLASVEYVSSHMVAKLLTVQQRVHARGGKMVLCDVRPRIYAALRMANLDKVLDVRPLADDRRDRGAADHATDSGATMPLE